MMSISQRLFLTQGTCGVQSVFPSNSESRCDPEPSGQGRKPGLRSFERILSLKGLDFTGFRFAPGFEGEAAKKGHGLTGALCSDFQL